LKLLESGCYAFVLVCCLPGAAHTVSLEGTQIKALVFHPAVANSEPASQGTVIALHGCAGLYATTGPRKGQLNARHQGMADSLVAKGYNAVFRDSRAPRGETELCTQKTGSRKIDQTERRADVLGTLALIADQPWAQPNRIALLGWSPGGSAVLSATDSKRSDVLSQAVKPTEAVALYPACAAAIKSGYKPSAPLVLMLGDKDDWTPPGPCIALGRDVDAEVNVFADSHHDFDNLTGQPRLGMDVPNGVNPGQGVHLGPNPVARALAYTRLRLLLVTAFKP